MLTVKSIKEDIGDRGLIEKIGEAIMENESYYVFEGLSEGDTSIKEVDDGFSIKGYNFSFVQQSGGTNQGSSYFGVAKVSKGDDSILLKVDGWYQSYYGSDCDDYSDWKAVEAKEKVIVQYEEV